MGVGAGTNVPYEFDARQHYHTDGPMPGTPHLHEKGDEPHSHTATSEPPDRYGIVFSDPEPDLTSPEAIADWLDLVGEAMDQIDNGRAESALTPLADLQERMTERLSKFDGDSDD
jgi:hypothetical protein